jgi:cytochrome c-type biogenesis protein CcmH/NrfG
MKKTIFIALLAIFSLSAAPVFAAKTSANATAEATTKLTEEEVSNYRARVEEIREMDKSELSSTEKKELKSELKEIKETMRKDGSYIYIGGGTLLVIIIILLIL